MIRKRRSRPQKFRNKRRILSSCEPEALTQLASRVHYKGKPDHKIKRGDFDLDPPYGPHPGKTLCDVTGIFTVKEALRLLREGVSKGLISTQIRGRFPQNVWAVTDEGIPVEAALHDRVRGVYHGYPIPRADPFGDQVLKRWSE